MRVVAPLFAVAAASLAAGPLAQGSLFSASFDAGPEGFAYRDDVFRGTAQPAYADGAWDAAGGRSGGGLRVSLGGIDAMLVTGMSGAFEGGFTLTQAEPVELRVWVSLAQTSEYEPTELSEALIAVDGVLVGHGPFDHVFKWAGNGNGGGALSNGWKQFAVHLGTLAAGPHTIALGGHNNRKDTVDEATEVRFDDLSIERVATVPNPAAAAQRLVEGLDFDRFKNQIQTMASFGDRTQGSASYAAAQPWLDGELTALGYTVQRHDYEYQEEPRQSTYVTKVGTRFPDRMYIISGHFDGRGGGGAADDDGSGSSLTLECARAFAQPGVQTEVSVRFVFWNNEETGLDGSRAYVRSQMPLQGVEQPPGSGLYPEPMWLGMVQHDMILFDHGLPPGPTQVAGADMDIEYRQGSTCVAAGIAFANALLAGNGSYSATYPAEIGNDMNNTDSVPFRQYTGAVSIRENQRVAEIGMGANPHWHQPTDVFATYSDADFRLGFDTLRTTLGTIAELAGTSFTPTFVPYGAGCPGTAGTPVLDAAAGALPLVGESFVLELTSLPGAVSNLPFGILGASDISFGGIPLPLSLAPVGMPGCFLYASLDAVVPLVNAGGSATWTIPLPLLPSLIGGHFFTQGLVVDFGVNPANLIVANAGDAEIGSR
ncbi:MAG: M28 family peptidase [Planctomycetota bacterium]